MIPARNEQEPLPKCLDKLKAAAECAEIQLEIIVVLNRCTDNTEVIARERGCQVITSHEKNLSLIRNAGVNAAQADYVITIDADSVASQNFFIEIKKIFATNKYIGGGVWIIPERWSLGIMLSFLGLFPFFLYWRIACGAFYFHKEDFKKIGGFNPEYFSAEDVDFARRLKTHGKNSSKKFKMFPRAYITTSCRKFDRLGDWYFIKNLVPLLRLLKAGHSQAADKIWYDFER